MDSVTADDNAERQESARAAAAQAAQEPSRLTDVEVSEFSLQVSRIVVTSS